MRELLAAIGLSLIAVLTPARAEEKENTTYLGGVPTMGQDSRVPPAEGPESIPESPIAADPEPGNENLPFLEMSDAASVLYDSQSVSFDKNSDNYNFSGDVVLIGGGYVITADLVEVAYTKKELTATGHVVLIHQNQVFTGDRVHIKWESGDFTINNALLVAADQKRIDEVSQRLLGLTPQELEFEAAKKKRLEQLAEERKVLRDDFRRGPEQEPSDELVSRYTRLLEQDALTSKSQAPTLAQQDGERRRRFERRRVYWEKSRAAAKAALPSTMYFRLQGDVIERADGNSYLARDASFTPCICADGETPAWGFQADEIAAQQEGYVNLKHPVLTIKGIPIVYLPFLKLPMKAKRQSGFLMPSFQSGEVKNGFVYTQPVFFDFGQSADATVTTDLFQKRGVRGGLELRYQARQTSGIRYQVESIRDSSWLQLGSERRDLLQYHLVDQPFCQEATPEAQAVCEEGIKGNLTPPSNTWRGKQEWDARYALAPRLSFVSSGKVVSDHRYLDDLYLPEELVTAFAFQANSNQFSTAKAKFNFDGKDLYAGLESAFADNALITDSYAGQQLPVNLTVQSRYFRLFPASWWRMPTYAEIRFQSRRIAQWGEAQTGPPVEQDTLGRGTWQRLGLKLTTPLYSKGVVLIDHFAEAETRYIEHQNLLEDTSTIRSWVTGINFNLPIDGMGPLPGWAQPSGLEGQRILHHSMNWGLRFSLRPVVVKDGPYGDVFDRKGASLVYFPSDRGIIYSDNKDVPDEDVMIRHERITLSTNHVWALFDRVKDELPAALGPAKENDAALNQLMLQARQELRSVKDREVRSIDQIYSPGNSPHEVDWLIRRYKTADKNYSEPVQFNAEISYDANQEKLRKEQIRRNEELEAMASAVETADPTRAGDYRRDKVPYYSLPESWSGPSAALRINSYGVSLGSSVWYNLYKKASTSLAFELSLPTFYTTQFGARYVLEKSPEVDQTTKSPLFKRTRTTTLGLSTQLIPLVTAGVNLVRKHVEEQKEQYGTSFQIGYDDSSQCWGLRFLREKDLNEEEKDANYIMQLAVIFLGNRRNADVSPAFEREAGVEQN